MDIYKIIAGLALSLILCGCKQVNAELKNDSLKTTRQTTIAQRDTTQATQITELTAQTVTEVMKENQEDNFAKEKARLKKLLSQFSRPLEDEPVTLDLMDLGAKYAQGYKVKDQPIKGFAYLFSHQDEHAAAYKHLTANYANGKYHTLISSNGAWLFWTYSEVDTEETQYIIYDLASAFSGEE